jgi:hypothetical protein
LFFQTARRMFILLIDMLTRAFYEKYDFCICGLTEVLRVLLE